MMPHKEPEARKAYQKAYKAAHKDELRVQNREWAKGRRSSDPEAREKALEAERAWRARNPDKVQRKNAANYTRFKTSRRRCQLRRNYGLSLEDYEAMLVAQGGVCAICGDSSPGPVQKHFAVDHDHDSGKIRGLLCFPCNTGIGGLRDDVLLVEKALSYLKAHLG
jgi:hypothetical protein